MTKEFFSIFQDSLNSFEGQKDGERVLLLLRRHPFVIIIRLIALIIISFIPIVLGMKFFPFLSENGLISIFLFATSIWYLALWIGIFHALTMYTLDTVIITDHRIIDSDQKALFNRKVSELHSNRIQDVSAHTSGLIETLFKFGNVTVQSAGSETHFIFHQVPDPEKVKTAIMQLVSSQHSGVKV